MIPSIVATSSARAVVSGTSTWRGAGFCARLIPMAARNKVENTVKRCVSFMGLFPFSVFTVHFWRLLQQHDDMRQGRVVEVQSLGRFGFEADAICAHTKKVCHPGADGARVRANLWSGQDEA